MTRRSPLFAALFVATFAVGCAVEPTTDKDTDVVETDVEDTDVVATCPDIIWPAPTAPACEAATLTCLQGATTAQGQQDCVNDDANPSDCITCINSDAYHCATADEDCGDELGAVECCLDEECPNGNEACLQSACETEFDTFSDCVLDSNCGITNICFASE